MRGRPRLAGRRRSWTDVENGRLLDLVADGYGDAEIGRRLGRTGDAVQQQRLALDRLAGGAGIWSARGLAAALGVGQDVVVAMVRRGLLPSGRTGRAGYYRIPRTAVRALVADRRSWGWWSPDRVVDTGLRRWAAVVRPAVRLLTVAEVAERQGWCPHTVWERIKAGVLPAVEGIRPGGGGRCWLVFEEDAA